MCIRDSFIAALKTVVSFIILSGINLELTLLIFVLVPVMIISCTWFNLKVKEAFRDVYKRQLWSSWKQR